MRFLTFLKKGLNTQDKEIDDFSEWLFTLPRLNQSSDPAIFGLFLEDKIPEKHIIGYKKAFIAYYNFDKNQLPKRYEDKQLFLRMVNNF